MDKYQDKEAAKDDYAHIRDLKDSEKHDYSASWKKEDEDHIKALKKDAHYDAIHRHPALKHQKHI